MTTGLPSNDGVSTVLRIAVVLAVVLAAGALIVSLVRGSQPAPAASRTDSALLARSDPAAADGALCTEFAPLIKQSSAQKKAFTSEGRTGTPARDAAIRGFVSQTEDWVKRAQQALDDDAGPPRFLTRTLQRYVDDMRLYATGLRPGPAADADIAAWMDSLVALEGPYKVCGDLGVPLW
jgi:hypothetical protein